ncbi:nuclear transport factor 2 family protein [Variovorax ureilyticus]|uniref:Nuclear transport factor 2 family protein n=1 Tax=Variovorax ureilyticus TaxID=1836198 RepID=A0ABU8VCQ7_9BURK
MLPVHVVQRQFEAYNAHDLGAFLETYAENAELYRAPSTEPVASGKAAISELYATKVFTVSNHRAELLGRMVCGTQVVDHERVFGLRERPFEVVAVYHVANGLIERVWLFPGE